MEEMIEKPVTLCGEIMNVVDTYTYLGDQISGFGVTESVMATIMKRKGLVCKSIREIRSMIDDCRAHMVGGIRAGIQVWELAVIPYSLNNCDTWTEMSEKATDTLNKLQNSFFCHIFAVGSGCPSPAYLWDTATLTMTNRIIKKKLLFYHHLKNLPEDTLAKEILTAQEKYLLPGLAFECQKYLADMTIYDNPVLMTSFQWKKKIKIYIDLKNRQDLLSKENLTKS